MRLALGESGVQRRAPLHAREHESGWAPRWQHPQE